LSFLFGWAKATAQGDIQLLGKTRKYSSRPT